MKEERIRQLILRNQLSLHENKLCFSVLLLVLTGYRQYSKYPVRVCRTGYFVVLRVRTTGVIPISLITIVGRLPDLICLKG